MRRLLPLAAVAAALLLPAAATADRGSAPRTIAVIGDTPYGDEQVAAFPRLVADVNADRKVRLVLHLGDIKNGSSTCTDERFLSLRALYDRFRDPFAYTPGDNEWTDCHRPAAGGYLPTERLDRLREIFYPEPGRTLGGRARRVDTQAREPGYEAYVENQRWTDARVVFSLLHVVGSSNDLAPWFGTAETAAQRELRLAEFAERQAANLAWLEETFAQARAERARGVVLAMQADTFATPGDPGFTALIERITQLTREFRGPVLLLQGDTHRYLVDRPLPTAPNLTRIVVEGETADEWLRLRVDPRGRSLFSWERRILP